MTIINLTTTTFAFSMTSTQKLGNPTKALEEWKKCIKFCIAIFPPVDDTNVALHVFVALCAYSCNEKRVAMDHKKKVLKIHDLLFGGDTRSCKEGIGDA
jgi:hypothetical protein